MRNNLSPHADPWYKRGVKSLLRHPRELLIHSLQTAVAFLLAPLLTLAQTATNSPSITCLEPVFDFGRRNNTEDVYHNFLLENKGNAPLAISEVRSGCGCTRAELDRNTIPPGESATLFTQLTLRTIVGPKRTSIYLHTNDPSNLIFQCELTGTSFAELDLTPPDIRFGVPVGATNLSAALCIRNNTDTPLNLLGMVMNAPFCSVQLATNVPGKQYTLTSTLLATSVTASTSGTIILLTDHPKFARIEIPVTALLIRDLSAYPPELVLQGGPGDRPAETRYIVLQSSSNKFFKVRHVEAIPPRIPVALQSQRPGWARLKVGPMRPNEDLNGTVIRVQTDYPRQPTVDIRIRVAPPEPTQP